MIKLASFAFVFMLCGSAFAADPSPAERFQALTSEAEGHYAGGRFQAAIDSYLLAYDAVPSPDALYNVGYIYESNLKKPDLASDFYRRVVRDPTSRSDLIKLATERINAIEAAKAVNTVGPTVLSGSGPGTGPTGPNVVDKSVKLPPAEGPSVLPWVLMGVGGAVLLGGIFVGLAGASKHSDFEDHVGGLEGMRENADSGKTLAVAGDVMWIGGVALAGTGLALLLMQDDAPAQSGKAGGRTSTRSADALRVMPSAGPDGAGVTLQTGF